METVFITIHDLSLDARIKYCSESIEDILGYRAHEVTGKSCWEYFHPDEIPFARAIHGRSVSLDKAAVLNYCRIKHKDGAWIGCECVFTVVHDVMVASTAIYRRGPKARQRALDGAGIRRIFSSSPRDPRYHMLSFISNKFYQEPVAPAPEPRAALFLNRFTRTSTIMYATNGVSTILGLDPGDIIGKSFYYCIQENCLQDAVKCLESAKANDSIAYLRFWYRDPLQDDNRTHSENFPDASESDEDDDGGVPLRNNARSGSAMSVTDTSTPHANGDNGLAIDRPSTGGQETTMAQVDGVGSSGPQAGTTTATHLADQNREQPASSWEADATNRTSSLDTSTDLETVPGLVMSNGPLSNGSSSRSPSDDSSSHGIEIEAVVSCSSDGLVVILRRARPLVPHTLGASESPYYANGLFASPWAPEPVMPSQEQQATATPLSPFPTANDDTETGFMAAIRDVAVFAWSLTGINGSLAQYARGAASGEALPPGGLPVWDPDANSDPQADELFNGFLGSAHRPFDGMDRPAPIKKEDELGSSDDEVVWKRTPTMPPWRRPQRRGHEDAFGAEGSDGLDGENKDGGRKRTTKSQSSSDVMMQSGSGSGSGSNSGSGPGSAAGSA